MKTLRFFVVLCILLISFGLNESFAGDWKFPLYFSYIKGLSEVSDVYIENMNNSNDYVYYEEGEELPFGAAFQPYYENDFGLRFGGGAGPISLLYGGEEEFYCLPVNICVGYTLLPMSPVSPYIKLGISYPLAGGGYVESKKAGLYGAVGIEFMKHKRVNMGFECAVDNSKVTLATFSPYDEEGEKDVKPVDTVVSFFVIF